MTMTACRALAWGLALQLAAPVAAAANDAGPDSRAAAAMRALYAVREGESVHGPFDLALHLRSIEGAGVLSGEIQAVIDHPFATAGTALTGPSRWCDILILHLNTKYCRASVDGATTILHVDFGRKHEQPLGDAHRMDFDYGVTASAAGYLRVQLGAPRGPLGTSDYRIVLEAVPAKAGQTFIRFTYSYSYGVVAQLAMQAYLGTIARDKVGFTVIGREVDGRPRYIGGMRGVVERNAMRYYLAVEAYLGALSAPPGARVEKSLRDWFTAIERYPRQLHEMERDDYLVMKRKEFRRGRATDGDAGTPAAGTSRAPPPRRLPGAMPPALHPGGKQAPGDPSYHRQWMVRDLASPDAIPDRTAPRSSTPLAWALPCRARPRGKFRRTARAVSLRSSNPPTRNTP